MFSTDYTEPVAYTYEADIHCPDCTRERFGLERGQDPEGLIDSEGNPVRPVLAGEIGFNDTGNACGDCGDTLLY